MGEKTGGKHIVWKFAPGGYSIPPRVTPERDDLTPELQKYMHVLGPTPKRCLEALADLGMSDVEIGHYFRMPCRRVTELRQIWRIDGKA
ncbi:hypothetical protein ACEWPL_014540 [Roseovarius sp. S1116L3]|uniref:hypothetical protein n=1 Tax=Roseovarius roseus TaxID=3342636 RepID=UPI003729FD75